MPNIVNMMTDNTNTNDATVTSIGEIGGARVMGIGPVIHSTYDVVSNESGQIQIFHTEAEGFYIDGVLRGDEEVIDIAEDHFTFNEILPQEDSFMVHQIGFGVTKGVANGGDINVDVNRYGGKGIVFSGGIGLFDVVGADAAHSFGIENGNPNGVEVFESGAGVEFSPSPITAGYYQTESHPVLDEPIQIPEALISVCQVVGQCGN